MKSPDGERPGAAPPDAGERKERVLHTRVPESLDHHLKRRARSLGMSVSTVVRNVLLNTFGLVENIVTDSTNVALAIAGEDTLPPPGRAPSAPDAREILAWQEVVLNLNAVCAHCNAILRKGSRGAIAVHDHPGPRTIIICAPCLGRLEGPGPGPPRKRRR